MSSAKWRLFRIGLNEFNKVIYHAMVARQLFVRQQINEQCILSWNIFLLQMILLDHHSIEYHCESSGEARRHVWK